MFFMPAYVHGQRSVIVKVARVNPDNSRRSLPTVLLSVDAYDAITGTQVAEIEGEWLTAIRTAASSAVATDLLARKDAKILGIFGSGIEARAHIPALNLVRKFNKVVVYSRDKTRRETFAKEMSTENKIPVVASDSPEKVASGSDVIVTATTSETPLFNGNSAKSGAHVNAIGSASPETREIDTSLIRRSETIVDSRAQALASYGDIMIPIKEGVLKEEEILELGDLLNGRIRPTSRIAEITVFKAGGLAVLDAMVANYILESLSSVGSDLG